MLAGRRIILTGASEGIGRALALALATAGAKVALAARDRDRLETLAQECRRRGGEALAVPTDISNAQDCEWLVQEAAKAFGGIDVVIHNAGITMWSRFDALTDLSIFETLLRVNYLGPVHLTAHALPLLRQSKGLLVGGFVRGSVIGSAPNSGIVVFPRNTRPARRRRATRMSSTGVNKCCVATEPRRMNDPRMAFASLIAIGTAPSCLALMRRNAWMSPSRSSIAAADALKYSGPLT